VFYSIDKTELGGYDKLICYGVTSFPKKF